MRRWIDLVESADDEPYMTTRPRNTCGRASTVTRRPNPSGSRTTRIDPQRPTPFFAGNLSTHSASALIAPIVPSSDIGRS